MSNANKWLVFAVAAVVVAAWLGRYEITAGDRGAYKLDRWTGDVLVCFADGCKAVN